MKEMIKKSLIILGFIALFVVVFNLSERYFPLPDASKRIASIPLDGSTFSGKNIPLTENEERFFGSANAIRRIYKISGDYYYITIVDGTLHRNALHDPYFNFKEHGWTIAGTKEITIPRGVATLVTLERGDTRGEGLFWYSDEEKHEATPLRYWFETVIRRITLGKFGKEPILVVVEPINRKTLEIETLEKNFPDIFNP